MAAMKLFVFTVLLSLVLAGTGVDADASISDVVDDATSDGPDSAVLEQHNSKINSLEYHIEEKTREIKDKDLVIAAKEKLIKEKSESIVSLESEIATLQSKENSDAVEQLGKAHARADELEKQVEKLEKVVEVKIKENEQLGARVTEAEKKTSEMNTKVNSLQKIIDDQQTKLRKTERALQIAEEEMMKAKYEAASKTKELMEVHGAWFPPWFAAHLIHYQSLLETKWHVHGKPACELLMQKAIEKKARAEEWAAPHVETMKTKWVPVVKEQWVAITSNVIEMYEASKNAMCPHIVKVVEVVDPYFQEFRKISNLYIDQVATVARPHVDTLRIALKPYTQKTVHGYRRFLESAKTCHLQVQNKVHEKLRSHELTEPLATKKLAWLAALLALPVIFLMKVCSAVFW